MIEPFHPRVGTGFPVCIQDFYLRTGNEARPYKGYKKELL